MSAATLASDAPGGTQKLRDLVRRWQTDVAGKPQLRPLGRHFDVVITTSVESGAALLDAMDAVQPGGCGPVIGERGRPWLYWVVPPRTSTWWDNTFGACVSIPWKILFPPLDHQAPPGPYWVRPYSYYRLVGPHLLADTLDRVQPELTPYASRAPAGGVAVIPAQLPFRIEFDAAQREVVVAMTYGDPPHQRVRRKTIESLEALVTAIAEHRHEAFLQTRLAQHLASAAVQHLGAEPARLEAAVNVLSDPTSTTPVSQLLRGTPPPQPG